MFAVYVNQGGHAWGYKEVEPGEVVEVDHVVVDSLPEVLLNRQPDCRVVYDPQAGTFNMVPIVIPEQPPSRIELLESENALMALQLANTQVQLAQLQDEQAALLLMMAQIQAGV